MKKLAIALTLSLLSTAAWANHSAYTPVGEGNCRVTGQSTEPLDSFTSVCPGRDKMRVSWSGFDARDFIGLTFKGKSRDFMVFRGFGGVIGKKLEWRYSGSKLIALIVRMSWTPQDGETTKAVPFLAVIRVNTKDIEESCIIDQVKTNEEAQAVADDLSNNTCLYQND